jgi:uncharacterized protein involved in exopolysaccharide biosynthesis
MSDVVATSDVNRGMTTARPIDTQNETDRELGFLDLLTMLGEGKWIVLGVTLIATLVGIVMSLVATPIFTSTAVIMPAQQGGGGSAAGALAQLTQVPGFSALTGMAGGKSTDQLYVALMRSQTMQQALIKKHHLLEKWGSRSIEDTRLKLSAAVSIGTEKQSGFIKIVANDTDPNFASELANSHIEELQRMLEKVATTEAQQRRMFYDEQITKVQTSLSAAEVRYREAQERSGIQVTSVLAETALRTSAELRAKITSLELQLQASSLFVTVKNPDAQRATSELAALRAKLAQLEQGSGRSTVTPRQQEAMRAFRELKVQETMLDAFVRQLEIAKIDEARAGGQIQIVDIAIPAEIRSSPQRTKMVTAAAGIGFCVGVVLAFLNAGFRRLGRGEENRARWDAFLRAWALRSH